MDDNFTLITECIDKCLLSKLAKEYHENDIHSEYQARNSKLKEYIPELKILLENADLMQKSERASYTISHLLILYLELQTTGPWNTEKTKHIEYSEDLDRIFSNKCNMKLNTILQEYTFDCQLIFDKCIQELHKKMTIDDFKKYPSLIEVYCLLIDITNYKVEMNPVTVLPVALLLIDDYVTTNKIKGFKTCSAILQCLINEDFTAGNYYEVVYSSLKKNMVEKDIEVTQALFQCLMEFLLLIPYNIRKLKLDDIYSNLVDQLNTESNVYRKAECFVFITKVIEMHGLHCVKKRLFKDVMYYNIDICTDESVSEILLLHVLECLRMWLRYCWCVWKLTTDHKMMSSLFKILYLTKEETVVLKIQDLIITLIDLCTGDERVDILETLNNPIQCQNEEFVKRSEVNTTDVTEVVLPELKSKELESKSEVVRNHICLEN